MSQVWKDLQRCPHSGAMRAASYHSSTSKDSKIHYINANSIHTDIYYTSHSIGLKPAWKNARKSKNVPVLPIPPPYRSTTCLQSRVSHKALQSGFSSMALSVTANGLLDRARLTERRDRDEARRWFANASVFEERNCVKSRDGLGAKLRIRTVCMCALYVYVCI